jgi:catechol 2,3-dioxygenase-like lactoylglutathione lyase family enzyme
MGGGDARMSTALGAGSEAEGRSRVIVGVFHTGLSVSSLERSMAFYRDTLGIANTVSQVSDQPYLAGVTGLPGCSLLIGFARVEGESMALEMLQYIHPPGVPAGTGFGRLSTLNPAWAVEGLEAMAERLAGAGVPLLAEPHRLAGGPWEGATSAAFLDPDGLIVELLEPAAGAPRSPAGGRLTSLHHTTFCVSDIDRACETLVTRLGLELATRHTGESETARLAGAADRQVDSAWLTVPGSGHTVALLAFRTPFGPPARPDGNNTGSGHLCFYVDDMPATCEVLRERGVRFLGRPTEITAGVNRGAMAVYVEGPDGIRLELFQRPPATSSAGTAAR